MKAVVVLACLVAVAIADIVPILHQSDVRDEAGQFSLTYTSGDGSSFSEQGVLKPNAEGDGHVLVKKGSFSYTSPEGTPIQLQYSADENGFQATGDHLPVAPSA